MKTKYMIAAMFNTPTTLALITLSGRSYAREIPWEFLGALGNLAGLVEDEKQYWSSIILTETV